jgi:hypothetical protein
MDTFILTLVTISLIGAVIYFYMLNKHVTRQPQKVVLFLMGGPLIWAVFSLAILIRFIETKIVTPFEGWLTKQ